MGTGLYGGACIQADFYFLCGKCCRTLCQRTFFKLWIWIRVRGTGAKFEFGLWFDCIWIQRLKQVPYRCVGSIFSKTTSLSHSEILEYLTHIYICICLCFFPAFSKGPSMPLEPEPDVSKAPSPPTDPPGSPEPAAESAKPKTSKKKSKVEAWFIQAAEVFVLRISLMSRRRVNVLKQPDRTFPGFLCLQSYTWCTVHREVPSHTMIRSTCTS